MGYFSTVLAPSAIAGAWLTIATGPAFAGFEGVLSLLPPGCETTGKCRVAEDFGFVDATGLGWQAAKGLLTDGASIPTWAQPLVGEAFDKSFIKAAIIHDHYCVRHVRSWRKTHKVFHEALLSSGVSPGKAGIMYFAVLVGGPKWVKLVQGKPCPVGMACINQFDVTAAVPGGQIGFSAEGGLVMARDDLYETKGFDNLLREHMPILESKGDDLSADEVEILAAKAMDDDFYFKNADEVGTTMGVTTDFE